MSDNRTIITVFNILVFGLLTSAASAEEAKCELSDVEVMEKIQSHLGVNKKIARASELYRGKNFSQALQKAEEILTESRLMPNHMTSVNVIKARSLYQLGRIQETITAFEEALTSTRNDRKRIEFNGYINDLKTKKSFIHKSDDDPKPLVRIPPYTPAKSETSGYCDLIFDVKKGKPRKIRALYCSDPIFKKVSIKAISKWRYLEQSKKPQLYKDVETTVRFLLFDQCGNIIPE